MFYLVKLSLGNKERIETVFGKQKLRKFIISRSNLPERKKMLNQVLSIKNNAK